jgi:two-component system C4-dicarboxylate transport sensor histidine kinase DctB
MDKLAEWVATRFRWAIFAALAISVIVAYAVGLGVYEFRVQQRVELLATQIEQTRSELAFHTRSGTVMGAMTLFGIIDEDTKRDALGSIPHNSAKLLGAYGSVADQFNADAIFVVKKDGRLGTTWERSGQTSTGQDVNHRHYFQQAIVGLENIFPAISLGGDRGIYFAAPVYRAGDSKSDVIGVMVTRTGMTKIDALLDNRADMALLISPLGVVFSSSRREWIGHLAREPSIAQRQTLIRLRQFGALFEGREPPRLPLQVRPGRQIYGNSSIVSAAAPVQWNDPAGDWELVLFEDLDKHLSAHEQNATSLLAGLATFAILGLLLHAMRKHYAQLLAARQVAELTQTQVEIGERKAKLAAAALAMQTATSSAELASLFLTQCHGLLDTVRGAIYVLENRHSEAMTLAASYGCADEVAPRLMLGQGLLGQCAKDRLLKIFSFADGKHDEAGESGQPLRQKIKSGLGHALPGSTILAPIAQGDSLLGAVEIAALKRLGEGDRVLFEELLPYFAANLRNLREREIASSESTRGVEPDAQLLA